MNPEFHRQLANELHRERLRAARSRRRLRADDRGRGRLGSLRALVR